MKISKVFQPLIILAKSFVSDICLGTEWNFHLAKFESRTQNFTYNSFDDVLNFGTLPFLIVGLGLIVKTSWFYHVVKPSSCIFSRIFSFILANIRSIF